jgi:hypothetical protein
MVMKRLEVVGEAFVAGLERRTPTPAYTTVGQAAPRRANRPDHHAWPDHVRAAAGCTHPVQLAGRHRHPRPFNGLVPTLDTADLSDGIIFKPCSNRRATGGPACATA